MAPAKLTDRAPPAVVRTPPHHHSRLPPLLRLPVLLIINVGLLNVLWTVTTNFWGNELGLVSKVPDQVDLIEPVSRLLYKFGVIYLGWSLNYDFIDIAALTAIANIPYAYLLNTYYTISPITTFAVVAYEVAAIALPTYLLRPRSAVHNTNAPLRNRFLLDDTQVTVANVLLAAGVYIVVLWSALKTDWLNVFLISHFDLPTLESAHAESVITLFSKVFPAAVSTKTFLLNPAFAAEPASGEATPTEEFNAATATLPQTVKHNFWFFSRRTRTLIQQTAILSVSLGVNTVLKCLTLSGTDIVGAAGYSSSWILAAVICAGWYGWVGDTEA